MTQCPCCGGRMPDAPSVLVDDNRSSIIVDGEAIHITPSEGWVMEALIDKYPKMVTRDQLLAWLYAPGHEPDDAKIVQVYICRLRKLLLKTRIKIQTVWGRGYRLEMGLANETKALDSAADVKHGIVGETLEGSGDWYQGRATTWINSPLIARARAAE